MERLKWTDERLNDRFSNLDKTLERMDRDIRELRAEMQVGFAEMRQLMYRMFGGLFVTLVVSSLLHGGF